MHFDNLQCSVCRARVTCFPGLFIYGLPTALRFCLIKVAAGEDLLDCTANSSSPQTTHSSRQTNCSSASLLLPNVGDFYLWFYLDFAVSHF